MSVFDREGGRAVHRDLDDEDLVDPPRPPGRSPPTARLPTSSFAIARGIADALRGPAPVAQVAQVQAKGDLDGPDVHALAARGLTGGAAALPFLDQIQRAFGHHDVSGIRAHIGGPAAAASAAMNARAYASGDAVAFADAPDLHTAAHEAAHVVQQRGGVRLAGGVGRAGDEYERHADQVADAVVRGDSAEALLDRLAHRGAAGGPAVQRREGDQRSSRPRAARRPAREPRTRDGHPVRDGDALIPPAGADPDTHATGNGGDVRNASQQPNPQNPEHPTRNPAFAPSTESRPPLNPYEGDQTATDRDAPLFDQRGPNYDDVQQGFIGDCYLMAALSAVAQMDPARIRRMVTEMGDGRYSVTFWVARNEGGVFTYSPHQEIVTNEVPTTTGGDPAFGGAPRQRSPAGFVTGGQRELWVSIVERAYAQWRGGYREAGNGGFGEIALEELTGTQTRSYDPRRMDPAEIIQLVERALRDGAPVIASTACDDATAAEHGLFSPHAYSVLSAGSGTMLLRNQHNHPTRGGRRIRIDAAVLRECFQSVAISGARAGAPVHEGPATPEPGEAPAIGHPTGSPN